MSGTVLLDDDCLRCLHAEADAGTRAEVAARLDGDPALRATYLAEVGIHRRLSALGVATAPADAVAAAVLARIQARRPSQRHALAAQVQRRLTPRPWWRRPQARILLAAAVLAAVGLAVWAGSRQTATTVPHPSPVWQRQEGVASLPATLTGHGRLEVPPGAAAVYACGPHRAVVDGGTIAHITADGWRLDAGGLDLSVGPLAAGHTFIVATPETRVTVTGTRFSVLRDAGRTLVKVREGIAANDYSDPGWYAHPPGTVAYEVASADIDAPRRAPRPAKQPAVEFNVVKPGSKPNKPHH